MFIFTKFVHKSLYQAGFSLAWWWCIIRHRALKHLIWQQQFFFILPKILWKMISKMYQVILNLIWWLHYQKRQAFKVFNTTAMTFLARNFSYLWVKHIEKDIQSLSSLVKYAVARLTSELIEILNILIGFSSLKRS